MDHAKYTASGNSNNMFANSITRNDNQLQWAVTGIILMISAVYWWYSKVPLREKMSHKRSFSFTTLSSCPNPNCIRCHRYRHVQRTAIQRLPYICKDIRVRYPSLEVDRVVTSITKHPPSSSPFPKQAPTVLFVHGLSSKPFVTDMYPNVVEVFSTMFITSTFLNTVLHEIHSVSKDLWTRNDTPRGYWLVLSMLNQGTWNDHVTKMCPILTQFIQSIPNRLEKCLFGNAFVSCIEPGTCIEPHCGPTNVRHRLQYTLQLPTNKPSMKHDENDNNNNRNNRTPMTNSTMANASNGVHPPLEPQLKVHDTILSYKNHSGTMFIFDDSFEHSVDYEDYSVVGREQQDSKGLFSWFSTMVILKSNGKNKDTVKQGMAEKADLLLPELPTGRVDLSPTIISRQSRIVLIVDLWHFQLNPAERTLLQELYPPYG